MTLKRSPLKRTPMVRSQPRRDWSDATAKVSAECCRSCGDYPVQAAHVLDRSYDGKVPGSQTLYVHPDRVVPLCGTCHARYDGQAIPRLSLWGLLTVAELVRAVEDKGTLGAALARIAPAEWRAYCQEDAA